MRRKGCCSFILSTRSHNGNLTNYIAGTSDSLPALPTTTSHTITSHDVSSEDELPICMVYSESLPMELSAYRLGSTSSGCGTSCVTSNSAITTSSTHDGVSEIVHIHNGLILHFHASLPTPPPEIITQTTELPTPPPEAVTPDISSTTRFLRPERKQTNRTKFFNPCPSGRPLMNEYETPITCNYLNRPNGGCPEDYWCHTGASFSTTSCCPRTDSEDQCAMRRDTGEGNELVARWYYDKNAKQCRRFLYKGLRGNMNNFVTKTQCVDACETVAPVDNTNPCRFGSPARHTNQSKVLCGPNDVTSCPANYYCHLGEDPLTTVCCESSGVTDPCLLTLNVGQGKAMLKRYYYNTFSKHCVEFVYRGTKGNENNFLSKKQCQDTCQKWSNPCPTEINFESKKECSLNGTECSADEWCHIGSSQTTTVCCPGASADPCSQPLELGEGSMELPRWYADPHDQSCTRQCKPFLYKGAKGNQNNFLTKTLCERKCKRECKSPCGTGIMLLTPAKEPRLCSPTSPCPQSHWCHVGLTPETTVCCSTVPNTCELPLMKGVGSSHLTRWHFDSNKKKCVKFIYSGEGGNQNMFLTQDDCQAICPVYENPCGTGKPLLIGSVPKICSPAQRCPSTHFCHIGVDGSDNYCCPKNGDPCAQELAVGEGMFALTRYYYDKETRRCREFVYQGTKGNANNFLSLEDCELVCPVLPNPCKLGEPLMNALKEPIICGGEDSCINGYWCHVGGSPETTNCCPGTRRPCDLPLETGQGSESLERWFYDGGIQMCRTFTYKGMKGNANNFLTKQACRQACKELNPCGFGEPLIGTDDERVLCTGGQKVDSCPRGHYCHVGASALTTVCCPKKNIESCDQPVDQGTGGEDLPRWFFDRKQNRCAPFNYGGIGGNENNFISQTTCSEACPVYRNYCPHGIPLVEGNQVTPCGIDRGCPEGFICHMSTEFNVSVCCQDPVDFCSAPRDPGPCTNFETRYGYNPSTDTCVEYQYGGCDGTLNNFHSLQRCTEICCKEYRRKL
uniref:Kunitz/Bovine pancreatic trypsin inhibitor domain protein n=1 Tax=Haemonchus contortus TaxID=6289 RepID=A0A7I4Z105_HAECO